MKNYIYKMCNASDETTIVRLSYIGVGISVIAVFTGVSKTNVINRTRKIASKIVTPDLNESKQIYEVDEFRTYISNKKTHLFV